MPGLGTAKDRQVSAKGRSYQGTVSMLGRLGFRPEKLDGAEAVLMPLHV